MNQEGKNVGSSTRPRRTAPELAEALAHRIQAGEYRAGDYLPSCRQLAAELSMDKNTVSKAYNILKEAGLVETSRGRGVYVLDGQAVPQAESMIRQGIENFVWRAKASGMAENGLWQILADAMWKYYGVTHVDVLLVECNQPEASHMAKQLETRLHFPVDTMLIDEFLSDPAPVTASYDILTTTFHHLSAISEGAGAEGDKAVGLHGIPIVDGVLGIVKARPGTRVGIVCSTTPSVATLTGLVRGYNSEIIVETHLVESYLAEGNQRLSEFVRTQDIIVDTMSTHEHVLRLQPGVPVVTVEYEIDEQSVKFLLNKILQITRMRLAQLPENESSLDATAPDRVEKKL